MTFGQTIWGNLSITLLIWMIPLLPIAFTLVVMYLNHLQLRLNPGHPPLLLARVILAGLAVFGLFGGFVFSLPYSTIHPLAISLSPDHKLISLNESIFSAAALWVRVLASISLLLTAVLIWRKALFLGWLQAQVTTLARASASLVTDSRLFLSSLKTELPASRREWLLLGGITLLAAVLRAAYFDKPFSHDEAYTYVGFASRTLRAVVTDYSLPNNHVFHTILVYLSTLVFGPTPWAIRLPAFLSGVGCIPAVYLLARRLYNPTTAILAAAVVAAIPDLVTRSTDARGYMLMALFTLVILWLGDSVRRQKNRLAWLLIIVFASLGFYTLPIMLFPFGGLLAWLTLSALVGETGAGYPTRWHFIAAIFFTGLGTILLTLLLYSTILIGSGTGAFFGNSFVKSMDWDTFVAFLPLRWSDLSHDWSTGIPYDGWLAAAGLLISLVFNKKLTRQWVPWLGMMLLWICLDLVVQRPDPMARLWTFLLPPLLIAVAAGWDALFTWLGSIFPTSLQKWPLRQNVVGLLAAIILIAGLAQSSIFYFSGGNNPGHLEQMVTRLGAHLQEGDWAMSVSVYEPPLWYYFRLHNLSWSYLDSPKDRLARRYFVILFDEEHETVTSTLQKRGVPINQIHLDQMKLIDDRDKIKVYEIPGPDAAPAP
jgi:hypothetical protein